ncbi:undecaprenyl-phosphate glucose phosphotransferase [Pedobacter frigiditerrae]|uniref:undecaprenyl-phosphate glucose phosphotransferase n=1 Tax=Pedobacter frigiditerrae TaxID=2530452 RepID=UPI001CED1498|nr:undecaprenyl-phosphate glucose phosphotransferase [Pedobacter frigiditerrae]
MAIQTRYIYLLRYILPVTDVLMLNVIYFASYFLAVSFGRTLSNELNSHHIVICNLIWIVSTAVFGLYTTYGSRKIERIYRGTWRSVAFHFVLFSAYLIFFNQDAFSRAFLVVFYIVLSFAFILNRFVGTSIQYIVLNKFKAAKKVAVLGSNVTAERLSVYLQGQRSLEFYGSLGDDETIYDSKEGVTAQIIAGKLAEAVDYGVKEVYVAVAPQRMADVKTLVAEADKACVRLKFIPDFGGTLNTPFTIGYMGGEFPIITLRNEPLEEMSNRFKKRAFDLVFSSLFILFVFSWLYPIIALLIKLESKGPVLFKQNRAGRNNEIFKVLKFRTMTVAEDDGEFKQATKNDSRITKIGAFLRRTSLDEIPQFINVFYGDMSVVGPRPHPLLLNDQYQEIIKKYMVRHFAKPGITGWAQVNGYRGETKDKLDMENRVKADIYYIENWAGMFDVRIVFMTVINMVRGEENAY